MRHARAILAAIPKLNARAIRCGTPNEHARAKQRRVNHMRCASQRTSDAHVRNARAGEIVPPMIRARATIKMSTRTQERAKSEESPVMTTRVHTP